MLKNKIMPFAGTWMALEIVIPSEVSWTLKDKYHMILPICGISFFLKGTYELIYKPEVESQM